MANQYPNVVPPGFAGNVFDFNKAKVDRSGALRIYTGVMSITTGLVAGSKIGIVPVLPGAKLLCNGSSLWFDALGTGVQISVGITYNPNSTQTEVPATYVPAATTTAAAGGNVALNQVNTGQNYITLDTGWLSVTTANASTSSTGNIRYNVAIAYDQGALQ